MTHGTLDSHLETSRGPTLVYIHSLIGREVIKIGEDIKLEHEVRTDFLMHDNNPLFSYHYDVTTKRINLEACDFPWETHVRSTLDASKRKMMFEVNEETM